ncbi:hypothetical protein ScalyP_jg2356 [Parmales sp. scaly parma]|nr:hypothetical protein ScalyP_jg2356 [Parmales sp. scaly parma]|tara:strand:- start:210 stop:905 length:696 start_codon:yes stop_codon:yes gene_type:complete
MIISSIICLLCLLNLSNHHVDGFRPNHALRFQSTSSYCTSPSSSTSSTQTVKIPDKVITVGDPQLKPQKTQSIETIMQELAQINKEGKKLYCILGTRHCSYLHQQIIELLSYALVLSGNHVFTSGSGGTNAAAIRGALRAERDDLLTVVLPQSLSKQPTESQELLSKVVQIIPMARNDDMTLDVASRLCNSDLLSRTNCLVAFAFHDSNTVIQATDEAKELNKVVTVLYLD